ncbi:phage tail protein [Sphingomonas sp. R647]|uniref:phage tail protein n=1 Tax=Sphingomonas sp. R647 TaxID=2875233 RepID=UPI001CD47C5F|nr:phage tail protein [Sphingomonas sp. R647]MCA1199151.1 phage tail protein [Sphingomonas sp. R647]
MQLLALGLFVFERETMLPDELTSRANWEHAAAERIGARPAYQFTGPGPEDVSIPGRLVPELGARDSALKTLSEMADAGEDYPLVDGAGEVLGTYRITAIDKTRRHLMDNGQARMTDFAIQLVRTG